MYNVELNTFTHINLPSTLSIISIMETKLPTENFEFLIDFWHDIKQSGQNSLMGTHVVLLSVNLIQM